MSRRGALIYFSLAAILGLVYLGATRLEARHAAKQERESRILSLKAGQLQAIRITRAKGPEVVIERRGGWRIARPVDAAVDKQAVQNVIDVAVNAKRIRALDAKAESNAAYGLTKPSLRIGFETGGRWSTLEIGADTFSQRARYARLAGRPDVFLISQSDYNQLDKPLDALRDRRLLPVDRKTIRSVTLERDGARFALHRSDKGWSFEGSQRPVSTERVKSLLTNLADTQVTRFLSEKNEDRSRYGLDHPAVSVSLDLGKRAAWLRLAPSPKGSPDAGVDAARSTAPGVVLLPADFLGRLPASAKDLENRRVFLAAVADARRLTVTRAGKTFRFARTNRSSWKREGPASKNKKAPDVESFLFFLRGLEHEGPPSTPAAAFSPEITIHVDGEHGPPLVDLAIAPPAQGVAGRRALLKDAHGAREVLLSASNMDSLNNQLRSLDPNAAPPLPPAKPQPASKAQSK